MSDDLVERARHNANADIPHHASVSLIEEMADRIERLEADLRRMALDYLAADGQAAEAYQEQLAAEDRIEELEAKLAKIESLMVHLVKFAEQSKATAGSGNSKRRGLLKTVSAVSEALGQIRKIMKEETK